MPRTKAKTAAAGNVVQFPQRFNQAPNEPLAKSEYEDHDPAEYLTEGKETVVSFTNPQDQSNLNLIASDRIYADADRRPKIGDVIAVWEGGKPVTRVYTGGFDKLRIIAKNGKPLVKAKDRIFESGNFIGVVTYFIRKVKTQ